MLSMTLLLLGPHGRINVPEHKHQILEDGEKSQKWRLKCKHIRLLEWSIYELCYSGDRQGLGPLVF